MTYANQLTVLRMVSVPCIVVLVVYGRIAAALVIFLLAGLTDLLDGLIARTFSQRTPLGTVLDPIADKLLLVSSFITLSIDSVGLSVRIPAWLTIAAIGRDVLLVVSVLIINLTIGRRIFEPSMMGKATTASQLLVVMLVLVSNLRSEPVPGLDWVYYAALALTVASGVHYMLHGMRLLGQEQQSSE